MRQFLLFIGKLLLLVVVAAALLDVVYTCIYLKSSTRNKIEYVISAKPQTYDVIFMGSSRTQNHMVAQLFADKGLKAYNYGMSGSRLDETALMLKLMLERHFKIKNIIMDVDLNINSNGSSEGVRALYMPYLPTSAAIRNHYKDLPEYNKLAYIPFYRYIVNDAKIGFREMFFSLVKKKSNALDNLGYFPLRNKGEHMTYDVTKYSPKRNEAYEEIKAICRKNNIHLIAIATPMCQECNSDPYFNQLQSVYPEIYNYENKVTDDKYFSSCGHLNVEGATVFTKIVLNDFLNNKFNP